MEVVQRVGREAVGADQHAAGAQHPQQLGEQPVLQRRRREVVEHRERRGGVEGVVGVASSAVASP